MATDNIEQQVPPATIMLELLNSFVVTEPLIVFAELKVADELAKGPRSAQQIAESIGADSGTLGRILRTLESQGVVAKNSEDQYEQSDLSETLRSDISGSMHVFAMMYAQDWYRRPFAALPEAIQNGGVAFENVFGMPAFDYMSQEDQAEGFAIFNKAMTSNSQATEPAIIDAYDFTQFRRIVDVGGGHGALLSAILKSAPDADGVLYDLPGVVSGAGEVLSSVSDRCEIVPGSFFDGIPDGYDAYVMKLIIHDWSDEQSGQILDNDRAAIPADGTLVLIDGIVPEGDDGKLRKLIDLHMMALNGGVERTEIEYSELLAASRFKLTRLIPTATGRLSVIEAKPV